MRVFAEECNPTPLLSSSSYYLITYFYFDGEVEEMKQKKVPSAVYFLPTNEFVHNCSYGVSQSYVHALVCAVFISIIIVMIQATYIRAQYSRSAESTKHSRSKRHSVLALLFTHTRQRCLGIHVFFLLLGNI
ncbi:hypothetical protein TRVL_04567 [Trypanosoma vivax]|nr:hypothetical protein TRVL_04567 [Trypanosoma vivax]